MHAIALGNVRRLRALLRPSIAVIGCGGVDSGEAALPLEAEDVRALLCVGRGIALPYLRLPSATFSAAPRR